MTYPDHVTVYHKLQDMPKETDDSFKLDVVILSERHRRAAARCVEDVVLYDYRRGKKIQVGELPFLLNGLRRTFDQQNTASSIWTERRAKLTQHVRNLETSSWDREDAVEDMGPAA